jgi:hypothetical protein
MEWSILACVCNACLTHHFLHLPRPPTLCDAHADVTPDNERMIAEEAHLELVAGYGRTDQDLKEAGSQACSCCHTDAAPLDVGMSCPLSISAHTRSSFKDYECAGAWERYAYNCTQCPETDYVILKVQASLERVGHCQPTSMELNSGASLLKISYFMLGLYVRTGLQNSLQHP